MHNDFASVGKPEAVEAYMKKGKTVLMIVAAMIVVLLLVLGLYSKTIFQRGNPLPYLLASMRICEETPYVEVGDHTGVYISKNGDCPQLFKFIEESRNVEFVEQLGSSYLFANEVDSLTVSSEVYWKWFKVWQVSQ